MLQAARRRLVDCVPTLVLWLATTALLAAEAPLVSRASFSSGAVLRPDAGISIVLSRVPPPSEGRLAIFLGDADWTDVFVAQGNELRLARGLLPLPEGDSALRIYLVPPQGDWQEAFALPFRVEPRPKPTLTPSLDVLLRRQFAEFHRPDEMMPVMAVAPVIGGPQQPPPPQVGTFSAISGQAGLELSRPVGLWSLSSSARVLGASQDGEQLRFLQKGESAPDIDLATWSVALERGRGRASWGQLNLPTAGQLIDPLQARGGSLKVPLGRRVDLTALGSSASDIVGFDDFLGVSRAEHRLFATVLGVELAKRPGALRLELAGLDASVQPLPGFNQGAVLDAEESRGASVGATSNTLKDRLRVQGSHAWSRFEKVADPQLEAQVDSAPLPVRTLKARHGHAELDVVKDRKLGSRTWNLTLAATHDRTDPLYRSVASAGTQGDQQQELFESRLTLGEATAQYQHQRLRDNLGDLAALPTTRTRRHAVTAALPTGSFARPGESGPPWYLPMLSYTIDRTAQQALGEPVDFQPVHLADQVSTSQNAAASWTRESLSFGYTYSRAFQDNRQPGRELADLLTESHGVNVSVAKGASLNLALQLGRDRNENRETARVDHLDRVAVNAAWAPARGPNLTGNLSWIHSRAQGGGASSKTLEADAQAGWRLVRKDKEKPSALLFVRGATQRARALDALFGLDMDREAWQVAAGLTISAF